MLNCYQHFDREEAISKFWRSELTPLFKLYFPEFPDSEILENEMDEEKDNLEVQVGKALSSGVCTYTITGSMSYVPQSYYNCYTCQLAEGAGCCLVCARICHKVSFIDTLLYCTSLCLCFTLL
jgi:hypothetical protein